MEMQSFRSRALAGVVLLALLALLGEAFERIDRFGLSASALGPWHQRPDWNAVYSTGTEGHARPIPGSWARWALSAGEPLIDYRFDDHGLRVPAGGGRSPAPGACRVLVIGDSNAFGYGVPAEDAYPAALQELLDARQPPAWVGNGGIAGSDVAGQRLWLEALLPDVRADVVLLTVSPWSLRVDPPTGSPPNSFGTWLWNHLYAYTATLRATSALADRAWRRGNHLTGALFGWPSTSGVAEELLPFLEPSEAFAQRFAAAAHEVAAMVALARAHGADVLLVCVPLDVQVSRERNRLSRNELLAYSSFGFVDRDYTQDSRYRDAVASLTAAVGIAALDMTDALRHDPDGSFLARDYHPSAHGHRLMAAALVDAVAADCERRRAASPAE
jgi:lysophospholipase L1-like esterase